MQLSICEMTWRRLPHYGNRSAHDLPLRVGEDEIATRHGANHFDMGGDYDRIGVKCNPRLVVVNVDRATGHAHGAGSK